MDYVIMAVLIQFHGHVLTPEITKFGVLSEETTWETRADCEKMLAYFINQSEDLLVPPADMSYSLSCVRKIGKK